MPEIIAAIECRAESCNIVTSAMPELAMKNLVGYECIPLLYLLNVCRRCGGLVRLSDCGGAARTAYRYNQVVVIRANSRLEGMSDDYKYSRCHRLL